MPGFQVTDQLLNQTNLVQSLATHFPEVWEQQVTHPTLNMLDQLEP